jgi:hypothetical protein
MDIYPPLASVSASEVVQQDFGGMRHKMTINIMYRNPAAKPLPASSKIPVDAYNSGKAAM